MSTATTIQPQAPPLQLLKLSSITPSPTNPVGRCAGPEFQELVESVRAKGVICPILVRELEGDDKYQLVAGERRFRAAVAANLPVIPAIVRKLTDVEAHELQLIENLQRKDITALEEAHGYVQLLETMYRERNIQNDNPTRKQGLVEEIAQKIGKSVRYVWARMKLAQLIPEAQDAVRQGLMTPSHADLLVTLPPKQQKEMLLEHFCDFGLDPSDSQGRPSFKDGGDTYVFSAAEDVPSVRSLKASIEAQGAPLKKSGWKIDDARVEPVCSACEKNTANSEGGDRKNPRCLDSGCYAKKREQLVQLDVAALTAKYGKDPIRVSESDYSAPKGTLKASAWKKAAPKSCEFVQPATLIEISYEGEDEPVPFVAKALTVCTEKKCKAHFAKQEPERKGPSPEELKRQAEHDREQAVRDALLKRLVDQTESLRPELLRRAAAELLPRWEDHRKELENACGFKLAAVIAGETGHPVFAKAIVMCLADSNNRRVSGWGGPKEGQKEFHQLLSDLGLPVAKVRAEIEKKLDSAPQAGKCQICGCTEPHACVLDNKSGKPVTCKWADASRTLCTNPDCLKKAKQVSPAKEANSAKAAVPKADANKPSAAKSPAVSQKASKKPSPAKSTKKGGRK